MWSTLAPGGIDAAEVARLFWIMTLVAIVIWAAVTALVLQASRVRRSRWSEQSGLWLIVGGGVAMPVVVLAGLLGLGLPEMSRRLTAAPAGTLRVHVSGEQWWWRVQYEQPGAPPIELANELRLPRGQMSEVVLTSVDVIHSFWVPSLAGKMDMIPGRVTRLTLEPQHAGFFRGVCAEYCGDSHARMGFGVEVMEPDAFAKWLASQSRPADVADSGGARVFASAGCGACHTVRGTDAISTIGPDLTHVGSRLTLAAGALPNTIGDLERWIANPGAIKPGALMPPFGSLPPADRRALAIYMKGLQ
jgi:cytochrome c oxidase subunit 2